MKRKIVNPDPTKKKLEQAKEKMRSQDLKSEITQEDITHIKKSRKK